MADENKTYLVYQGYNTAVYLGNAGGELNKISCTSISFSTTSNMLTSNASYAGALNINSFRDLAISSPFKLDYPEINCSLSFEPTYEQLLNIIQWLKKRNEYTNLIIENGAGEIEFSECYLQSLNISVSRDQLLIVSISLYVRENYLQALHILGGLKEYPDKLSNSNGFVVGGINTINNKEKSFIPYYFTGIKTEGLGEYIDNRVSAWSINFSQNIIKKTFCRGIKSSSVHENSSPLPAYIMFGQLIIDADFNIFAADESIEHNQLLFFVQFINNKMDDDGKKIVFNVYNKKIFDLSLFMLNEINPNVGDVGETYNIDIKMSAYGLYID